ncbi:MAG: NAD-dependent epimerase/dehydratase family protein [Deltaproteobacteria bacterium]|nr:NAD-dependent epimerase/dehydratase family protein [Deltaproteobacteria bacterium]MDQ3296343.1 NAD-dependent epimerase/dehydratase family protein [Myxococcota bacterium]
MTAVLVTGATGFLGEHLCRVLVEQGHTVRGLARSRSAVLADLGVEHVRGDVLDGPELDKALVGVTAVFHLAGAVSRDPDDAQRMMRLHVDGTRRVLERMAATGGSPSPRRMILASTSGTIGVSKDDVILDENAPYAEEIVAGWPYYASKIYQERLAFEHGERLGIEVVAVNPSLLLGPGDRRLSSTGDVRKFIKRQIPVVPTGGINFVDARDAALATANALTAGRPGQRYLLGGPNWTMKEFFARLGRVANVAPPRLKLPAKLNRWGATLVEELWRHRGKEPPVDRISVEMSEHYWWIDSSKAERELGFSPRDPQLTLVDTVSYLRQGVDAES